MKKEVTDITDDRELENEVATLLPTQRPVSLDTVEQIGNGRFQFTPPGVCAVLVTERSGDGVVRLTGGGEGDESVGTSPTQASRKWIIIIVNEEQTCTIYGQPIFRYFSYRT